MNKKAISHPFYFIIPAVLIYTVIFMLPTFLNIYFAFTDWNTFKNTISFNGLQNYVELMKTGRLFNAIKNTFYYGITVTLLQNVFGFILALLLYKKSRINEFFRSIFFAPAIFSVVLIGYMFSAILSRDGIINDFLSFILNTEVNIIFLGSPVFTIFVVAIINVWQWSGFAMIIYIASINSIPKEVFESAQLDGVNQLQMIKNIIIPMAMPGIIINIIIALIGSFRVFDIIWVMTKGGPGRSTEVFNTLIYDTYSLGRYGEGNAMNLLLLFIISFFAVIIYKNLNKRVTEL